MYADISWKESARMALRADSSTLHRREFDLVPTEKISLVLFEEPWRRSNAFYIAPQVKSRVHVLIVSKKRNRQHTENRVGSGRPSTHLAMCVETLSRKVGLRPPCPRNDFSNGSNTLSACLGYDFSN